MTRAFRRSEFIQYFKAEAFATEFTPLGLNCLVRMAPCAQLEFLPVECTRKIKGGPDQYLIIGDVAYLVDPHRGMILLVLSFQFFLFVIHSC